MDEYGRVHIEMRFTPTPDPIAPGNHSEWWFSDDATTLDDWARAISRRPEWGLLGSLTPVSVESSHDAT